MQSMHHVPSFTIIYLFGRTARGIVLHCHTDCRLHGWGNACRSCNYKRTACIIIYVYMRISGYLMLKRVMMREQLRSILQSAFCILKLIIITISDFPSSFFKESGGDWYLPFLRRPRGGISNVPINLHVQ